MLTILQFWLIQTPLEFPLLIIQIFSLLWIALGWTSNTSFATNSLYTKFQGYGYLLFWRLILVSKNSLSQVAFNYREMQRKWGKTFNSLLYYDCSSLEFHWNYVVDDVIFWIIVPLGVWEDSICGSRREITFGSGFGCMHLCFYFLQ